MALQADRRLPIRAQAVPCELTPRVLDVPAAGPVTGFALAVLRGTAVGEHPGVRRRAKHPRGVFVAGLAGFVALHFNFLLYAVGNFFQVQLQLNAQVRALAYSSATPGLAAAKEIAKAAAAERPMVVPVPLYLVLVRSLTRRIYEIEQEGCERFETVAKERYDVAGNVLTVKRFSQEQAETRNHASLLERARTTQYSAERLWTISENIQTLIATLGRVSTIVLAGYFVLSGRSSIGDFVLYLSLQGMIYQPLAQLSVIFPRLRRTFDLISNLSVIAFALLIIASGLYFAWYSWSNTLTVRFFTVPANMKVPSDRRTNGRSKRKEPSARKSSSAEVFVRCRSLLR